MRSITSERIRVAKRVARYKKIRKMFSLEKHLKAKLRKSRIGKIKELLIKQQMAKQPIAKSK